MLVDGVWKLVLSEFIFMVCVKKIIVKFFV